MKLFSSRLQRSHCIFQEGMGLSEGFHFPEVTSLFWGGAKLLPQDLADFLESASAIFVSSICLSSRCLPVHVTQGKCLHFFFVKMMFFRFYYVFKVVVWLKPSEV